MAHRLLENRLIACANLMENATSVYNWQGGVQEEQETVMIAKTSAAKRAAAIEHIRSTHSYQLPAVTSWPVADGAPEYVQWVVNETAGK